ncbi:MAG: hypothetical protein QXT64_05380 [Desulfurococcaceae archaeon]
MSTPHLERIKARTLGLVEELKRRKVIDLGEAALIAGYSYWYFRFYVTRGLMMLYPNCIKIEKHALHWVCEEK